MIKKINWPDYIVVNLIVGGITFFTLKYWFMSANNDDVRFLTYPINAIFSIINQSSWIYTSEHGFAHHSLGLRIDRSCSGFNFFLMSSCLFLFTLLPAMRSNWLKISLLPISFLIGYLFTIAVNSSRILVSLKLDAILSIKYSWIHEAQGAFIYLSFLIGAYLFLKFLIRKRTNLTYENIT